MRDLTPATRGRGWHRKHREPLRGTRGGAGQTGSSRDARPALEARPPAQPGWSPSRCNGRSTERGEALRPAIQGPLSQPCHLLLSASSQSPHLSSPGVPGGCALCPHWPRPVCTSCCAGTSRAGSHLPGGALWPWSQCPVSVSARRPPPHLPAFALHVCCSCPLWAPGPASRCPWLSWPHCELALR